MSVGVNAGVDLSCFMFEKPFFFVVSGFEFEIGGMPLWTDYIGKCTGEMQNSSTSTYKLLSLILDGEIKKLLRYYYGNETCCFTLVFELFRKLSV